LRRTARAGNDYPSRIDYLGKKERPAMLARLMKIPSRLNEALYSLEQIRHLKDLIVFSQTKQLQLQHPNPLNRFGRKCFSQGDEDGITLEILRRLGGLRDGVFAEFGVGDGMENNTLVLASLGWKGFWVGGEKLRFTVVDKNPVTFCYLQAWITLDNITALTRRGLRAISAESVDVVSLDLDGNDIYFVERLLTDGIRPKLFIVEYNAKFPPPIAFQIAYDPQHTWKQDDYFGASLASLAELFARFSYRLICCSSQTGANAFFVDDAHAGVFADVPTDIGRIYAEPRYYVPNRYGHPPSTRTVEAIINGRR
jgi:hypothetical protein